MNSPPPAPAPTLEAAFRSCCNPCQPEMSADAALGERLRQTRQALGLTIRALAERSGISVNTLSGIENGKVSPTVSTLQRLARSLGLHICEFFEPPSHKKRIVHIRASQRPGIWVENTLLEHLGRGMTKGALQPFVITLQPGAGGGKRPVLHSGYEFVYCLQGKIRCMVEGQSYLLEAGDSILFEAYLPHRAENCGSEPAQFILLMAPLDRRDEPAERHFIQWLQKERYMKFALITDDGKTISRHFGRASYYLVVTAEEGKVISTEMRSKLGHQRFSSEDHEHEHGHHHGFDPASQNRHNRMAAAIQDCEAIICGGMGAGAYESMKLLNIQPIVTELTSIDEAIQAYLDGTLVNRTEMLH